MAVCHYIDVVMCQCHIRYQEEDYKDPGQPDAESTRTAFDEVESKWNQAIH